MPLTVKRKDGVLACPFHYPAEGQPHLEQLLMLNFLEIGRTSAPPLRGSWPFIGRLVARTVVGREAFLGGSHSTPRPASWFIRPTFKKRLRKISGDECYTRASAHPSAGRSRSSRPRQL